MIVYRVDGEYVGGNLQSGYVKKHGTEGLSYKLDKEILLAHIANGSKKWFVDNQESLKHSSKRRKKEEKITREDDPFISSTKHIRIICKFIYGAKIEPNEILPRIFMIDLPDKEIDDDGKLEYVDFSNSQNHKLINSNQKLGWVRADREVTIYGEVDQTKIYEIHPLLADIMVALSAENEKMDNLIIQIQNKIKDGTLSVSKVNELINNYRFNKLEKKFIEEYYTKRMSIGRIADQEGSMLDKFEYQAMRTQITKDMCIDIFDYLEIDNKDENSYIIKENYDGEREDVASATLEDKQDVNDTSRYIVNGLVIRKENLVVKKKSDKKKNSIDYVGLPCGMRYEINSNGDVARCIRKERTFGFFAYGTKRIDDGIKPGLSLTIKEYVIDMDLSHDSQTKQSETMQVENKPIGPKDISVDILNFKNTEMNNIMHIENDDERRKRIDEEKDKLDKGMQEWKISGERIEKSPIYEIMYSYAKFTLHAIMDASSPLSRRDIPSNMTQRKEFYKKEFNNRVDNVKKNVCRSSMYAFFRH